MIVVRSMGSEERFRFVVVIKTPIEKSFYGFPHDDHANYWYIGSISDGHHDLEFSGEEVDLSALPVRWIEVVTELELTAIERAKAEGAYQNE